MVASTLQKFEGKTALKVNLDNIPQLLREKRIWAVWRYETHKGRKTKVPYNANVFYDITEHKKASSTDPTTWAAFDLVSQIYRDHPDQLDGIGVMMHPSLGIVGIDGDDVTPHNLQVFQTIPTYGEWSPSGKGVRLVGQGTLPENRGRKNSTIELYNHARFLTITGNVLPGQTTEIKDIQTPINRILGKFFPDPATPKPAATTVAVEDALVLKVAFDHDRNGKFAALWNCDGQELAELGFLKEDGTVDRSRVHAALCSKLAYYTRDFDQIERMVSSSACGQDGKWDARAKYRQRTIERALARVTDLYQWPKVTADDDVIAATVGTFDVAEADPVTTPSVATDRKRRGLSLAEIETLPNPEWLVKNHFHRAATAVIQGPPGTGKSFLALELAMCVATGKPYFGHRVAQGKVAYIYSEGQGGIKLRWEAYRKHHGIITAPANIVFYPYRYNLLEAEDAQEIIDSIRADLGGDAALVIIDTLARNFGGGNENMPDDMNSYVAAKDMIRETGATVVSVHHTGKDIDRGGRGHTSLPASVDAIFQVEKSDGNRKVLVSCEKAKDAEHFRPYCLVKTVVALGTDEDGDPITSVVLEAEDGFVTAFRLLKANRKMFLRDLYGQFQFTGFTKADASKTGDDEARTTKNSHVDALVEAKMLVQYKDKYHVNDRLLPLLA